jgi:cell division protein FtsL
MTRIRRHGRLGAEALKKKKRLREMAVVLSILVAVSLFYVWTRVAVVQTGYRLHDLAKQYEELEQEYRSLKLELVTQKSPENLGSQAQHMLGLTQPQPHQVVLLPEPLRLAEKK